MCGIAGIVDPNRSCEELSALARQMTNVIYHRGPDDDGFYVGDGVVLGMRRLSIIDVAGGQQPIANESRNIHTVCNGEIYNFRELRKDLEQKGHKFACGSDAEVLVHLYEENQEKSLNEIAGMFGAAIWDSTRNRLVLMRDRLGQKPLYYAHVGTSLYFASEIKSLLVADKSLAEPDPARYAEYLQFGFIHEPNSFYRKIKKLPAGHQAIFENNELKIRPYWSLEFTPHDSLNADQWLEQLDDVLLQAVRKRLVSEVPLGVFLSGGIDSSAMVAYAHKAGLSPIKTFTIAFDRPEWDESEDATRVANHFNTVHHVLRLEESTIRDSLPETLAKLIYHFDEPFADDSALPTWHVSQLAREHVTVILSGDGGDELFAGYSSYRGAIFAEQYRRFAPGLLGRRFLPWTAKMLAMPLPASARYRMLRVAKVLGDSGLPVEAGLRNKISIWNRAFISRLLRPELLRNSEYLSEQFLPDHLWATLRTDRDIASRLTEIDIHSYMRDDILMKVDRMSMATALEVRSPFMDHRLVELAARIPSRFKLNRKNGKIILKRLLARQLPPANLKKRKQGFAVPLRDWFRGGLRDLVGDYLLGTNSGLDQDVFDLNFVREIVHQHQRGDADHGRKIWSLLSFAAWRKDYHNQLNSARNDSESKPPVVKLASGMNG